MDKSPSSPQVHNFDSPIPQHSAPKEIMSGNQFWGKNVQKNNSLFNSNFKSNLCLESMYYATISQSHAVHYNGIP